MTTRTRLLTERLELVPLSAAALDALDRGEAAQFARTTQTAVVSRLRPPSLFDDAIPRVLEAVSASPADVCWWSWLAIERASRAPVGVVGFGGPPDGNGVLTIGYATYPAFRGRGLTAESVTALIDWAFEDPRVALVRATIPPENVPSRGVAERAGMTLIGPDVDPEAGEVLVYERGRRRKSEATGVARYVEELDAVSERVDRLVRVLSVDQLAWRPSDRSWSVGECVDHLVRAGHLWAAACERASARGRASGRFGEPPFRLGLVGAAFVRLMEPPARARFRAPRRMRPERPLDAHATLDAFEAAQRRLVETARAAEGLDLSGVIVHTPSSPFLWLNLAASFAAVAAHERRHVWQAEGIMDSPGFPETRET